MIYSCEPHCNAKMVSEISSDPKVESGIRLLSAWIESKMAYKGQPGLSIGIVHDQELVWAKGFGYADVEEGVEASSKTVYRIASITKLFTSTAIMQLRDEEKLRLDDPITEHLPWFKIQGDHNDSPPIMIRHLLTHTSGLPRESAHPYWSTYDFPTKEEVQEGLPTQEAPLPTEARWKYSNLALSLAGYIVEATSGKSYEEYVKDNILKPLGMDSTFVESPDPNDPRLATGYSRRLPDGQRTKSPFTDAKGITPAANMATSVEDLARFGMLQFRDGPREGSQILKGSTLREMHRVHWLQPDWTLGWGWGFNIQRLDGRTYIGHGGSVKGYRTQIRIDVDAKIAVIVLTNADDGDPVMYVEKAFQWVAPAVMEAVAVEESKVAPAEWRRYTGKYRNDWGDTQILILDGELVMLSPMLPDPTPDMTKLVQVSEHTFRMESPMGYGSPGELLVFELDEKGKVKRVKTGAGYIHPVEDW